MASIGCNRCSMHVQSDISKILPQTPPWCMLYVPNKIYTLLYRLGFTVFYIVQDVQFIVLYNVQGLRLKVLLQYIVQFIIWFRMRSLLYCLGCAVYCIVKVVNLIILYRVWRLFFCTGCVECAQYPNHKFTTVTLKS